jgi:antitoxin (DNA-binding transcriptional repressor) of toxin-antitoxin stability system
MTQHSLAHARDHLSDLIDRTLAGEDVVITREGLPVVSLKAVQPPAQPITRDDLLWLAAHRVKASATTGAGTLVSQMRDEHEPSGSTSTPVSWLRF